MNDRQESNMVVTALLPMKANSERVKGKNFRDFCGRPLFRWVLDTLLETALVDKVVINTDAAEILRSAGLVESDRVVLRERKQDLCGDLVSMNRIIADDVATVGSVIYLMTHTTNPLLSRRTIEDAIGTYRRALLEGTHDSLFTVDRVQTRFYRADGSAVNHDPANLIRTQDLEPWFEENSNLYLFTKSSFAASGARIGGKPLLYPSPPFESIDIDDQADWDFATVAARYLQPSQGS
jgi:CMP-N-acetylneuraminic acid synthetase